MRRVNWPGIIAVEHVSRMVITGKQRTTLLNGPDSLPFGQMVLKKQLANRLTIKVDRPQIRKIVRERLFTKLYDDQ
jgi:hypothetical protein